MLIHVRFDEIALKGGKRSWYEKKLSDNIARLLGQSKNVVSRTRGRISVTLPDDHDRREAFDALSRTFGVAGYTEARKVAQEDDLTQATAIALEIAQAAVDEGHKTFKIKARRADKSFPLTSEGVASELGGRVLDGVEGLTVDVHTPEFVIHAEVRGEGIYVYRDVHKGPGGMPVGTNGRALCLLSGGIDSPVAAWYALKRGLHVDHVYFHAFPYTGDKALEKVLTLARTVSRWAPAPTHVHVVSTTKIQDAIAADTRESHRIVLLRRAMYRLAAGLESRRCYQALVTGEAIGQVASQTLDNLRCVEEVVPDMLVIRPLIGFDKYEIINKAHAIRTFETSVLPYQDCCSLFAPKHPTVKATLEECHTEEARIDLAPLEAEALAQVDIYRIEQGGPAVKVVTAGVPVSQSAGAAAE